MLGIVGGALVGVSSIVAACIKVRIENKKDKLERDLLQIRIQAAQAESAKADTTVHV